MLLSLPPPVIPISVCDASPGPLTTHPIIDNVIGVLICESLSSKFLQFQLHQNLVLHKMGMKLSLLLNFLDLKTLKFHFQF